MPRKARVEFPGAIYHLICRDSKTDPFLLPLLVLYRHVAQDFNERTHQSYDAPFRARAGSAKGRAPA